MLGFWTVISSCPYHQNAVQKRAAQRPGISNDKKTCSACKLRGFGHIWQPMSKSYLARPLRVQSNEKPILDKSV